MCLCSHSPGQGTVLCRHIWIFPGPEEDSDEVISTISGGFKQTALPTVHPGSCPKEKPYSIQVSSTTLYGVRFCGNIIIISSSPLLKVPYVGQEGKTNRYLGFT